MSFSHLIRLLRARHVNSFPPTGASDCVGGRLNPIRLRRTTLAVIWLAASVHAHHYRPPCLRLAASYISLLHFASTAAACCPCGWGTPSFSAIVLAFHGGSRPSTPAA